MFPFVQGVSLRLLTGCASESARRSEESIARDVEQMTDAGDQPWNRSDIFDLHPMPGEALFGFGAPRQDRAELVDDAGPVGHQLGQAGLADLVDDDRVRARMVPASAAPVRRPPSPKKSPGASLSSSSSRAPSCCVTTDHAGADDDKRIQGDALFDQDVVLAIECGGASSWQGRSFSSSVNDENKESESRSRNGVVRCCAAMRSLCICSADIGACRGAERA